MRRYKDKIYTVPSLKKDKATTPEGVITQTSTRDVGERTLAVYATDWRESRGRGFKEPEAFDRTPFQRDRDRIIHSDAFRRLQYKTQVFTNHKAGDHHRTRLTHTLEVAQLARTICRSLWLDEDLGETVALAHDLGHPPFGHAGEDALDECMAKLGGFKHNDQTLRIVRQMEYRYGAFDGLNLTWEALEGIAKHNGPLGEWDYPEDLYGDLEPQTWCGLEAQVAAMSDDLAYNHHDLDDGLSMGAVRFEDAMELAQFSRVYEEVVATYPTIDEYRAIKETIRRMMGRKVRDLMVTSNALLKQHAPKSAKEVRSLSSPLIGFSKEAERDMKEVKAFLFEKMYRHYEVNRMAFKGHRIIKELFEAFMNHRRTLPDDIQKRLPSNKNDDLGKARAVANYISSLTDRSAMLEHTRLFGPLDVDN